MYDQKKKRLFPKFQMNPILRFRVMHGYVCFIAPIGYIYHDILCKIKSHVRDFLWKFVSFQWNDFSLIPLGMDYTNKLALGKCTSYRKATKICKKLKKLKLWKFWERPLFDIREYAFNKATLPGNTIHTRNDEPEYKLEPGFCVSLSISIIHHSWIHLWW